MADEAGNEIDELLQSLKAKIGLALPSLFQETLSSKATEQGSSSTSENKSLCVVTIFGKCDRSSAAMALASVSSAASLDPFQIGEALGDVLFQHRRIPETEKQRLSIPDVEAVYLAERSTLVLVVGLPATLYQLSASTTGARRHEEVNVFRYLTVLFSLSHIVVCVDSCAGLSLRYVTIFKALWQASQKTSSLRSDVIKKLHAFPNNVVSSARLSVPRLLFVFDCRRHNLVGDSGSSVSKKIRDMRHALEDQTYRILRHAHVVHPTSVNKGLVTIPNNEEFVAVIVSTGPPSGDSSETVLTPSSNANAMLMAIISSSTTSSSSSSSLSATASAAAKSPLPPQQQQQQHQSTNSFVRAKDFILRHVEQLQTENIRAPATSNALFMCSLNDWVRAFISLDKALSTSQALVRSMDRFLFVNSSFAETLCKQALESAKAMYADGLPRYYSLAVHQERFSSAKEHFLNKARSSVFAEKYIKSLETFCDGVFSVERRLCERVSIFGSVCTLPLHRLPGEEDLDDDENSHLPVRTHVCNVISKAACNCGRMQADRDDPFTSYEANFEFYHQLEDECCHNLHHVPLHAILKRRPKPAAKRNALLASVQSASETFSATPGDNHSVDSTETESLDQAQTLSASVPSPSSSSISPSNAKDVIVSSWSLLSLGQFSVYTPSRGLVDFPGFVSGAHWLLPVGIGVNGEPVSAGRPGPPGSVAAIGGGGRGSGGRGGGGGGSSAVLLAPAVVVYVGVEFECPKGHRFLLETPEKAQRVPLNAANSPSMPPSSRGGASSRQNAAASEAALGPPICSSDIPLFFSCCQCPSKAPSSGQLMRLFVLVPPQSPSSVGISLAVRVQASSSFVFTPLQPDGCEEPEDTEIPLTANNLWVLRFPLVYTNKNGSSNADAENGEQDPEMPILPVDHADYANFRLHANFLRFELPTS